MTGRPPRNRNGNYLSDAQQLIHLSRAVGDDETQSLEWRADVSADLRRLARVLMDCVSAGAGDSNAKL